jgi:hypothetical protein
MSDSYTHTHCCCLTHCILYTEKYTYSPEHPTVKGLFFVGASTRPGNGLPLVLTGAQLVADRIISQHPELFTDTQQ